MSAPFLIFGLPRSRTAWLAAFLCGEGIRCEHELLARCRSFRDFRFHLTDRTDRSDLIFGNADSGMLFYLEQVLESAPEGTRMVLVERDPAAVCKSWERLEHFGALDPLLPRLEAALAKLRALPGVLRIPFAALDERIYELWDHVTCGALPFPLERFGLFQKLNIQLTNEAFEEGMLEALAHQHQLEESL